MESYKSFAEVYDLFMDNVPYDDWAKNISRILKEHGIADGLVCELGCGTGQMTRRLQSMGYDMIGIDNSIEMLDMARMQEGDTGILYLCQDMREFELYGTVRAVISVCDSMNYITGEEDLLQVFRLANNYLDPGGIFLFDLNTTFKYAQLLGDGVFAENRDEGSFIWENEYDAEEHLNYYDLTLYIREGEGYQRYEEEHVQMAYELDRVKVLIEESGLEFLGVLDAETMAEPREDSERVYIIAREQTKTL
ncbi:MAG: class I SAM-dependent methyltransferase [Lachnospiraceae bacterium]|nr:class I SAM-dependent methyltransferase [Lachnospiraceae bacterium]